MDGGRVFRGAGAALVALAAAGCTSNNGSFVPFSGSGGGASGAASGAASTGASTGARSGTMSGGASGTLSGASGGSGMSGATGSVAASCEGPTRYVDTEPASCTLGKCVCAGNAYSLKAGEPCTCQSTTPTLCTYDAGRPPQCVDDTTDPGNCGACGNACPIGASCNAGKCGRVASELVAPAPGCLSMRVVYDNGRIYWSDMGHGTIESLPVTGGGDAGADASVEGGVAPTTIASGIHIAAVQTNTGPLLWPASAPLATSLLVRAGTVYFIGASNTVTCDADAGACSGGVGTTIFSATPGSQPKLLLAMGMAPGPSPVSATDAQFALETPGQNPPINAIALSPAGNTLYFAAGTRFYSIPAGGAGAVTYVGFAEGPEHGIPTTLFADDKYLYYPAIESGNVEIAEIGTMCDPDAAQNEACPVRAAESQAELVYDTLTVRGGAFYWGNNGNVRKGDTALALTGALVGDDFPPSAQGTSLSGFALGTQYAYFGEPGADHVCSADHTTPCVAVLPPGATCDRSTGNCTDVYCRDYVYQCPLAAPAGQTCVSLGYVEKGLAPPFDGGNAPSAIVLARDQPNPMSFALDGTNVYWTTSRCDIRFIADGPQ